MAQDKTVRYLTALSGASSGRVLNLSAIAAAQADNPEHKARPLFNSPVINAAIILKHRLRSDETYLFARDRSIGTKVILPFDPKDLRAGGRSLFVEQRGFADLLREAGNYGSQRMDRDIAVFRILDRLPSLDPFLLRESLRAHDIECADCYFEISASDQEQMHDYACKQLGQLIELAVGGGRGADEQTSRLVAALLATQADDKLEPLRATLGMQPEEFREGVFSWRGFIYYKWSMGELWPSVLKVARQILTIEPLRPSEARGLRATQEDIFARVYAASDAINQLLAMYDAYFAGLVEHREPKTFREFLLSAPHYFLKLGEGMGAISHIVSFWHYRFPSGGPLTADGEELTAIFNDFLAGFPSDEKSAGQSRRAGGIRR